VRGLHVTGRCGRHRWMRWEKRGFADVTIPVGLRAPKPDDFCDHCRNSRAELEGIPV
jgi:hypothetical protein